MDEKTINIEKEKYSPLSSSPYGGGQGGGNCTLSSSSLLSLLDKSQRRKWLFYFSLFFIFFSSCTNHGLKNKKKTDLYWYVQISNSKKNFNVDTFKFDKILKPPNDFLLDSLNFIFKKKKHCLRLYSNFYNKNGFSSRIDIEFFTLDSIGVIYSNGVNGRCFSKLISTNDSINRLINFSIREIKRNKSWFKFVSPIQETKTIFLPPIIYK
jgi:hypothetical protein